MAFPPQTGDEKCDTRCLAHELAHGFGLTAVPIELVKGFTVHVCVLCYCCQSKSRDCLIFLMRLPWCMSGCRFGVTMLINLHGFKHDRASVTTTTTMSKIRQYQKSQKTAANGSKNAEQRYD